MSKKLGGKVHHWQLHHLKFDENFREGTKVIAPEVDFDNLMILTGTIEEDPSGRWNSGDHFRSSLIVKIDRDKNIIETQNSIYIFDPKTENQDIISDLGNDVAYIEY